MDIKVFLVSDAREEMRDFFLYRFIMLLPKYNMQLRCSTELSGDYIAREFIKIYVI